MSSPSPIEPGLFYHIYNRGTNRENIFVEERNYPYFLQLYTKYIEPVAETYAYCLLKNHFHLLVRIKEDVPPKNPKGAQKICRSGKGTASAAFSNFFNAYAKAINRAYNRTGSLFQHPFGRIQVGSPVYLLHLVRYIHHNPQKHGLVHDFRTWPYSSYHIHISEYTTHLHRDAVLSWFDNLKGFTDAHSVLCDKTIDEPLAPDDED